MTHAKDKYIIIGTSKIHYVETAGYPETIVLLHAWPACAIMWDKVIEELGTKYHVIAIDLPGFGHSEPLNKTHNIRNYLHFLNEFFKKKQLRSFHLVGYSFGSILASLYSLEYSHKIKSLVLGALPIYHGDFISSSAALVDKVLARYPGLIDIFNTYNKSYIKRKIYPITHPYVSKFVSLHRIDHYYESMYTYNNRAATEILHEIVHIDLRRKVREINKNTLILVSDHDGRVKTAIAEKLHKYIKKSKLVVIKDGDHALPVEHPKEFALEVDNFVKAN